MIWRLQALFAIPQNPNQCSLNKLGFSTILSRWPSMLGSRNLSLVSKVTCSPLIAQPTKCSFVVRAESNSEGEGEASDNVDETESASVDEVPEVQAEAEEVSDSESKVDESKPPRKPRVKLGDVMGVMYRCHFVT